MVIRVLAKPIESLGTEIVRRLHCARRQRQLIFHFAYERRLTRLLHNKKFWHVVIGVFVMYLAGLLYHDPPKFLFHEFWELTAFGMHGLGIAPVVRVIADLVGMEV